MRRRGFTLVEVLVAAAILLLGAAVLLESLGYARAHGGANRHRERAAALAVGAMESALRLGYTGLPVGTTTSTTPLEDDGSIPCTLTRTVTQDATWTDVQGLRRVAIRASWTEPLMNRDPTLEVRLESYIGDPVP